MKNSNKKIGILSLFLVSFFIFACSNKPENVDIQPPEVVSMSPANESSDVPINAEISVRFDKSITNITTSNFYLTKLGVFGNIPCSMSYDDTSKTATLVMAGNATFDPDTVYLITLDKGILSRTGVAMKPFSWAFTTGKNLDTTPPTIASGNPGYDAVRVPVAQDITVVFSEQLQSTTITTENVVLTTVPGDVSAAVSCEVTYNDVAKKIVINPAADVLADNTKYFVILSQNIQDLAGNPLAGVTSWSFTTNDLHDPTILKKTPDGSVAVPPNTEVSIDFSESLQNSSEDIKTKSAVYLYKVGYALVLADIIYDDEQHQIIIKPETALEADTQYEVFVTSQLKDRAGNNVDATNWTFTTNSVPDTVIPTVDKDATDSTVPDSYPLDDGSEVPVSSSLIINFSESVSGLNSTNCILQRVDNNAVINCNLVLGLTKQLQMQPVGSLSEGVQYRIHLTAGIKDSAGNSLADTEWVFITDDNTKPVVIEKTPGADGNINITTPVVVKFSESVANVSAFTFIVKDDAGNPVPSSVNYIDSTKTATLTPVALSHSKTYTVILSPDENNKVRDKFGNTLSIYYWSFSTSALPDTILPEVLSGSPLNSGVSLNPVISVIFSENVTGLTNSNFVVKQGTTVINGILQYNQFTYTASFQSNSTLEYSKVYTVTIIPGLIEDNSNNKLVDAPANTFSFTTLADTEKPIIKSKTPDTGNTVAANAAVVTVYFSENVIIPITAPNKTDAFTLTKSGGARVDANFNYDPVSKKATLIPVGDLVTSDYIVTLTKDVVDYASSPNSLSPDNSTPITWTFSVIAPDRIAPTVIVSSRSPQANNTGVALTSNVEFTFDESVKGVNGTSVTLTGGGNPQVDVVYSPISHKVVIDPELALAYNTVYTVNLSNAITDDAGNPLSQTSWSFTTGVDNIKPLVVSGTKSPVNGVEGIAENTSISLTFNEEITNYNFAGCITLYPAVGAPVTAGAYTYLNKTLTFKPTANLASSMVYTVKVSDLITDTATPTPNTFAGIPVTSWKFTTGFGGDLTPPTIISRNPANTSTDILQNSSIVINFSEDIKYYSSANIYICKGTNPGPLVPATVSYNKTTYVVTVTPNETLIGGTRYYVNVKAGTDEFALQDIKGLKLAADPGNIWYFNTIADTTKPLIAAVSPLANITTASTKGVVDVTFSESVTGVNDITFTLYRGATKISCFVTYDSENKKATLTPSYDLLTGTVYTATLTSAIKDLATVPNTLTATGGLPLSWSFTTTTVLPEVATGDAGYLTSPKNSDTGISVTKNNLVISFNTAMDTSQQWAELTEGASTPAGVILDSGTWSNSDKTITYKVTGQFKQNTTYRLKLYGWGGTFKDKAGNVISKTANLTTGYISFTTGADTVKPSVVNTFPKHLDTSVGRDIQKIILRFSEPMNQALGSTVTISPAVTGAASTWIDDGRTLVYSFSTTLASQQYAVSIGSAGTAFKDLNGNDCNLYSFTFTTGTASGSASLLTEGFEVFTQSTPSFFTNASNMIGDSAGCDWSRINNWGTLDGIVSGNNTSINGPESFYFAKAAALEWGYGDYGDLNVTGSLGYFSFSTSASYLLSFQMMHECYFNGADRIAVYARAADGNFVESDLVTDNAFNATYRYNWSRTSGAPVWSTHYIDLSHLKGNSKVYIKLRGISGGETGSNVLVDDLKVTRY